MLVEEKNPDGTMHYCLARFRWSWREKKKKLEEKPAGLGNGRIGA